MVNSNCRDDHSMQHFAIRTKQKDFREIKQSLQEISSGDSRFLHSTENRILTLSVKPVKQVYARISRTASAGDTETLSFSTQKKTIPGDVLQSRHPRYLKVSESRLRTLPRKTHITVDFDPEPVTRMAPAGDSEIIRNAKLTQENQGASYKNTNQKIIEPRTHFQDIVDFFTSISENNKGKHLMKEQE